MKVIIRAVVGIIAAIGLVLIGTTPATAAPPWASVPKPTQVDNCGTDNDHFLYANTGAIDYATVQNADGTWTITATPKPGYKIHRNTVTTFDYPAFGSGCIVVSDIPAPAQIDNCGPEGFDGLPWWYWSIPWEVEGVRWSLVATTTGYTVTATAAPGYTIDPNTQSQWTFPPFTNTPC